MSSEGDNVAGALWEAGQILKQQKAKLDRILPVYQAAGYLAAFITFELEAGLITELDAEEMSDLKAALKAVETALKQEKEGK